jgi:hypothetical protein
MRIKEEETMISAPSSYSELLPFPLVDIGVDYGEFLGRLHVFESGSK